MVITNLYISFIGKNNKQNNLNLCIFLEQSIRNVFDKYKVNSHRYGKFSHI